MSLSATTSVFFVGGSKRARGRPQAQDPLDQRVTIRMSSGEYDRLIQLSMKQGEPVTSVVRQLLKLRIPKQFPSANK